MKNVFSAWIALSVIIPATVLCAFAADKEKSSYPIERAVKYAAKSTQDKVTVAVKMLDNPEENRQAFGKANLLDYGVLPVLVVIDNDSNKAIRLNLKCEFVNAQGKRADSMSAEDVQYRNTPKRPNPLDQPARYPIPLPKKKNKLETWEIKGRAFSARMVPAGESVSGFFYFNVQPRNGSSIYLNGLSEAASGKDLFYFEIPLP